MNDAPFDGSNAPPPPVPMTPAEVLAYLEYEAVQLYERRAQLIAALDAAAAAYPVINDDDTLAEVAENIRLVGALSKLPETRRVVIKEPFKVGGETVDAWFKRFALPLSASAAPIQKLMNEYGERKLAKQRAADIARRAAAQIEADRLANEAIARMQADRPADAALDAAADAAAVLEVAERAVQQRASKLTQTRSVYGAVASVRETWSWEVEDIAAVPRNFLMVDADRIKEMAKVRDARGKPTAVIAGIRWIASTKMGVR